MRAGQTARVDVVRDEVGIDRALQARELRRGRIFLEHEVRFFVPDGKRSRGAELPGNRRRVDVAVVDAPAVLRAVELISELRAPVVAELGGNAENGAPERKALSVARAPAARRRIDVLRLHESGEFEAHVFARRKLRQLDDDFFSAGRRRGRGGNGLRRNGRVLRGRAERRKRERGNQKGGKGAFHA